MKALVRYSELHLKSEPVKRNFLRILKTNIERSIKGKVSVITGRLLIDDYSESIQSSLRKTFGVFSFSPALEIEKDLEMIKKEAVKMMGAHKGTFAVRATRADKDFRYTSKEIENIVGEQIVNKGLKVDLTNPDKTIFIEIRKSAYLYTETERGPGGMPLGSGGCANAEIKNEKDFVASWSVMKRGVDVATTGKKELIDKLKSWSSARPIPKCNSQIFVSGETEIENIIDLEKSNKQFLFPLVGMSNEEIEDLAAKIA